MTDPTPLRTLPANPSPTKPSVHFIGICGKAMGGIAAALAHEGWQVSGSDEKCYAPMMDYLSDCGIPIRTPYAAQNVPAGVGLMVVGKRVSENNPELQQLLGSGMAHYSFPQFLEQHFLHRSRNAVVAGGVGKTTTTAMLAWILEHSERKPDYLIGGLARNFPNSARFSGSDFAVLEGDEYAACFDDLEPKFLHYRPEVAMITNIVEDHPDLYANFEELCAVFSKLIAILPTNGCLIIPAHDPAAITLAQQAPCNVVTVGFTPSATEVISEVQFHASGSEFHLLGCDFSISLCGKMNVMNAAMAALAAVQFGVTPQQAAAAMRLFTGVHNRQEELVAGQNTVVCDKASHPRALEELASALRQRFPGKRLISVIQPRATGGRDWVYQRELPAALDHFDQVILTSSYEHSPQQPQRWANDPFCLDQLAAALLEKSTAVTISRSVEGLADTIASVIQDDDIIVLTLLEQSKALRDTVFSALEARSLAFS
jgi:UDP-N-acetylmuramate: L-alanyl-gamma-D-glutamyl-meso-diaminopimelate ligase